MSNLKEIKRKIKSVNNTQKTTKAMKLVSTAKLNKAKEAARRSKIYAQKIDEILAEISFQLNKFGNDGSQLTFFKKRELVKSVDIVFITADKGLCGGFNIKTIKEVNRLRESYQSQNVAVRLRAIGKTGIEYFNFQGIDILEKHYNLSSSPDYDKASEVIKGVVEDYVKGLSDEVILVHNGYKNMISQELSTSYLIPVAPLSVPNEEEFKSALDLEPQSEDLLNDLIKTYFEYNMYFALIDSLAAEHSARMQAMDSATNNAKTRVRELNLAYNKARQENITTELTEIISGVESMK